MLLLDVGVHEQLKSCDRQADMRYLAVAGNANDAGEIDAGCAHALHDEVVRIEPHAYWRGHLAGIGPTDGAIRRAVRGEIAVKVHGGLVHWCALLVNEDSFEALGREIEAKEERVVNVRGHRGWEMDGTIREDGGEMEGLGRGRGFQEGVVGTWGEIYRAEDEGR